MSFMFELGSPDFASQTVDESIDPDLEQLSRDEAEACGNCVYHSPAPHPPLRSHVMATGMRLQVASTKECGTHTTMMLTSLLT